MRLGAHVSTAGSLDLAIDRAVAIGCECLQIFVGNPRQWRQVRHGNEEKSAFRSKRREAGLDPLVAHSSYLINLASPDDEARTRSIDALVACMKAMAELDGLGVVTHIGSALGAPLDEAVARVGTSLRRVLDATSDTLVILENSAGATLGGSLGELEAILDAVDGDERMAFCLDTAHLFGAGCDIREAAGVKSVLDEFESRFGMDRLKIFHLNDSKAELASRRDRHENIGEGTIGATGFRSLLGDSRVQQLAGVLETPGFDGNGPDRRNLEILRRLAGPSPATAGGKKTPARGAGCGVTGRS